jgi:hypothetical protein
MVPSNHDESEALLVDDLETDLHEVEISMASGSRAQRGGNLS